MVLQRFLELDYPSLDAVEQDAFEALLDEQDPDLVGWLWGRETPPEKWKALVERIQSSIPE